MTMGVIARSALSAGAAVTALQAPATSAPIARGITGGGAAPSATSATSATSAPAAGSTPVQQTFPVVHPTTGAIVAKPSTGSKTIYFVIAGAVVLALGAFFFVKRRKNPSRRPRRDYVVVGPDGEKLGPHFKKKTFAERFRKRMAAARCDARFEVRHGRNYA